MQPIGVASNQVKRGTQGFTMVELLIVLVMLAILSAVALPNLRSGMRREQLAATSLGIISWLERARNQAVKDMEPCQITIEATDASEASLAIASGSPGCTQIEMFKVADQENTPTDVSLELTDDSDSEFSFSPRGSVNSDQEIELTMEGSPTTRCIKVIAPVGLVRSGIKRDGNCSYEKELKYQ